MRQRRDAHLVHQLETISGMHLSAIGVIRLTVDLSFRTRVQKASDVRPFSPTAAPETFPRHSDNDYYPESRNRDDFANRQWTSPDDRFLMPAGQTRRTFGRLSWLSRTA